MEVKQNPIQMKLPDESEGVRVQSQKDMVSKHMSRFTAWMSWRNPFDNLWTEIYRLYMTRPDKRKVQTRSRMSVPKAFQVVETGVPKLMSIIFGQAPIFDVIPQFPYLKIDSETLENIKALLDYQLGMAKFLNKFAEFAKQILLYGTAYFYVYWKVERAWVYERTATRSPFTLFGVRMPMFDLSWEKKLVYKVISRRPEVDLLAIEDVYPDPTAIDVQDGDGVYVVTTMPLSRFKELCNGPYPTYTNYKEVEETCSKPQQNLFKIEKQAIRGVGDPIHSKADPNTVELITFWGREDLDGDGIMEETQMVFANRTVLVKANRNGFEHQKRPIVKGTMFPVPREWYGLGLIEPIIGTVHELDTLHRQNIDMNNLLINRMWKVDPTADVDLQTLITKPNGIVLSSPLDGVAVIEQQPLPFSPTQLMQVLDQEIDSTTAPKAIQGNPSNGALGRTARGASMIIEQALEKFGNASKLLEEGTIKEVLAQMYQLDGQFLDSDESLQDKMMYAYVFPNKPSPEQLRSMVDFKLLGMSETVSKEATFNQIIAYVNTFAAVPGINLIEIARTAWELVGTKLPKDKAVQEAPFPQIMQMMGQQPGQPPMPGGQVAQNGAAAPQATPKPEGM